MKKYVERACKIAEKVKTSIEQMGDTYKRSPIESDGDGYNKGEILTILEKMRTVAGDIVVFLSEQPEIYEVFKNALEGIIEGYDKEFYYYDVSKEILNHHIARMHDLIQRLPYIAGRDQVLAYIFALEILLKRYIDLYEQRSYGN